MPADLYGAAYNVAFGIDTTSSCEPLRQHLSPPPCPTLGPPLRSSGPPERPDIVSQFAGSAPLLPARACAIHIAQLHAGSTAASLVCTPQCWSLSASAFGSLRARPTWGGTLLRVAPQAAGARMPVVWRQRCGCGRVVLHLRVCTSSVSTMDGPCRRSHGVDNGRCDARRSVLRMRCHLVPGDSGALSGRAAARQHGKLFVACAFDGGQLMYTPSSIPLDAGHFTRCWLAT